jgi:hypothetical protein
MAQDSMRPGPRGSSEQEAYVGPEFIYMSRLSGSVQVDKSAVVADGTLYSPFPTMGVDYRVVAVQICVTDEAVATADIQCTLGYNGNPIGSVAADDDAFVSTTTAAGDAGLSLPVAAGTVIDVALSGANTSATFGATNGPLVFKNNGAPAGTGNYAVRVLVEPVSGKWFSNK